MEISLYNNKYTVIFDEDKGGLRALRYGEEWRDCCGDGLILAMAQEIVELKQKINYITTELNDTLNILGE